MKTTLRVESLEQTRKRVLERARKLDKGERIQAEKSITLESPRVAHHRGQRDRLAKLEHEETMAGIRRGIADADAGRMIHLDDFIVKMNETLRRHTNSRSRK